MYFLWAHPYLSVAFWLFYVVTYFNQPEKSGRWSLDWLRAWSGWRRISTCVMQNQKLLNDCAPDTKLLFAVAPNTSLLTLFWSFGLHGQPSLRRLDTVFAVPRILLLIPLLRDVLMAAGAVEDDFATVQSLLFKGRAVCWCPSGMEGCLMDQSPDRALVRALSEEMSQECLDKNIHVAPVIFQGETARYVPVKNALLRQVQQYCFSRWAFPWPLAFRIDRSVDVVTYISVPISPRTFHDDGDWQGFIRKISDSWADYGNSTDRGLAVLPHDSNSI